MPDPFTLASLERRALGPWPGSLFHALPEDLRAVALGTEWFIGRDLVGAGAQAAEHDLLDGLRDPG
jgi:hypothetical protein